MNNNELLNYLANEEGYDDVMEMLEAATFDSVVPAICTECQGTGNMEPDQDQGHCEGCGNNTMVSCLILAGII